MTLGGLLYDPVLLQRLISLAGLSWQITADTTLRLPIYFTLGTALLTLLTTLRMREVTTAELAPGSSKETTRQAFRLVWQASRWIFRTPFVLMLLLCGLLGDSVIRMLLAMGGFVMPALARRLTEQLTPLFNLLFTATLILLGLSGMCFVWPWAGLLPALLLFSCMYLMGFFLSHYLNQATSSDQRATVLSFKGLFLNLGYGGIGLLYALLLAFLREQTIPSQPGLLEAALKNQVFINSLPWFVG